MEIRKRNGAVVAFCDEKIILAMEKAFLGQNQPVQREELAAMLQTVVQRLPAGEDLSVERVQDEVERALMERGHYAVAKAYILYREKRSELRRVRESLAAARIGGGGITAGLHTAAPQVRGETASFFCRRGPR